MKHAHRAIVTLALGAAFAAVTGPTLAHHSFAMFDFSRDLTVTGTVKEFRWTNPHVTLLVEFDPKPGAEPELWSLECTSPGNLTRSGWSRHSFKPGDRIKLEFNPLRDGQHGGAFTQATFLDTGRVLSSNLRAAEKPGLE